MVLPDLFIDQDKPELMYAQAGLDADGIVKTVFAALGRERRAETGEEGPFGPNSRCCRQSERIDCGRVGVFKNRLTKDADSPHQ